MTLNENIIIYREDIHEHAKASEAYIHVKFEYPDCGKTWDGWVPIEYRRTGISLKTNEEIFEYLNDVYYQMHPSKFDSWLKDQEAFWREERPNASTTKAFFDSLIKGGWQCVNCTLPQNPNWARRIQDLKEFGYTLSTDTKRYCPTCHANKTHLSLLPIKRGELNGNGYETWSPELRKRIIYLLRSIDIYENTVNKSVLPDHKFSEIKWDDSTKEENPDSMLDAEIIAKFQLLTNQRNQQKREVCRHCFQTGERGTIFGIPFFYAGGPSWDENIPKKGKAAEAGCVGCPWYDIEKWRKELILKLKLND